MTVTIQFLGAAGTVTGSKYLVQGKSGSVLIDCGQFQGDRSWREKNWHDPQFPLSEVSAVLITHAHIDHIGMLPRYFDKGLHCPVFCSAATNRLAQILLIDSAKLQEEEAQFRREHGKSRHNPPLPLYTEESAKNALRSFHAVPLHSRYEVAPNIYATWRPMGHIIGACSIILEVDGKSIVFSGDIGRYDVPILLDPEPVPLGDVLIVESTYGDREHSSESPAKLLGEVIARTASRGGVTIIPSFAVGRTQTILFYLRELKESNRIPNIPIIVDSPMAAEATEVYHRFSSEYDPESKQLMRSGVHPFSVNGLRFASDRRSSIALNSIQEPMIIISASGMLTGGRVLHHLKHRLPNSKDTVLFVGFQPPGSRGAWLKSGAPSCRILGDEVLVRAEIAEISGLSAHAGKSELLRWCRSCSGNPGQVLVTHGEPESALSFANSLHTELGWNSRVANYLEKITI